MVSEKMGLLYYRRCRGGGPVHNTNFLEKWLFSIIYCGKNIQSIFMKFSEFVYQSLLRTMAVQIFVTNTAFQHV